MGRLSNLSNMSSCHWTALASGFPPLLKQRVACLSPRSSSIGGSSCICPSKAFVLYLPSVALRSSQSPSLAVATRLAADLQLPLVTVLNVTAPPASEKRYLTPRRVAFLLEAAADAAPSWGCCFVNVQNLTTDLSHPALVAQALSMCSRAAAVVVDEPFVDPHLAIVRRVEANSPVAVLRVDSSTVVPPRAVWGAAGAPKTYFKAWQWQEKSKHLRREHVQAAMRGDFDAVPVPSTIDPAAALPACLQRPGHRPLEAADLARVRGEEGGLKRLAGGLRGCAPDAPKPCAHTDGSGEAGLARWGEFLARGGIGGYAGKRNDPRKVHGPSRMSCYTNVGAVSQFRIIHDVLKARGSEKFQDEILKVSVRAQGKNGARVKPRNERCMATTSLSPP